jgi:hypothetical protein
MSHRPTFFLDENMEIPVAVGAIARGVVVTTARDEGRLGIADDEQLAFARSHGYVLVTHDRGFEQRHWAGEDHAGIMFFSEAASIGQMVEWLVIAAELMSAEEFVNFFVPAG